MSVSLRRCAESENARVCGLDVRHAVRAAVRMRNGVISLLAMAGWCGRRAMAESIADVDVGDGGLKGALLVVVGYSQSTVSMSSSKASSGPFALLIDGV